MAFSFLEFPIYGLSHYTPCPNKPRSPLHSKKDNFDAIFDSTLSFYLYEQQFVHRMLEKNVCSIDCNEEKQFQKFPARFVCLLVFARMCLEFDLT